MNKVFLIGNLTRDPELTETAGGVSVCRFSLAVERSYTNSSGERETDFFNVTAWRGLADSIARYCQKGSKVAVSGSIQIRTYENNYGVRQTTPDIIAQDCEFLFQRAKGQRDGNYEAPSGGISSPTGTARGRQMSLLQPDDDPYDDGDLPF